MPSGGALLLSAADSAEGRLVCVALMPLNPEPHEVWRIAVDNGRKRVPGSENTYFPNSLAVAEPRSLSGIGNRTDPIDLVFGCNLFFVFIYHSLEGSPRWMC